MSPTFRPPLFLLLIGLAAVSGAAFAQQAGNDHPEGTAGKGQPEHGDGNLAASVRLGERQTGGEVLRAEPMQRDGREVYRVKVLTSDGRVRVIQDDPQQRRNDDPPANGRRRGKPPSENGGGGEDGDGE